MTKVQLTAGDLAKAIHELPKGVQYKYVNDKNKGRIIVASVKLPEGPITILRYNPDKKQKLTEAKKATISVPMLWRVANAMSEGTPVNVDRVLGASYNTRSALEALLAHTPQFHVSRPGRLEITTSTKRVKKGHKHLVWLPNDPHPTGETSVKDLGVVVSEHNISSVYEAVQATAKDGMTIEVARRHAQVQISLILIGHAFGCRSYIAKNDQGIVYGEKKLAELDGVVTDLRKEKLVEPWPEAAEKGQYIDCVWFRNGKSMPAVLEVEHSTGVTSGLSRMKSFMQAMPAYPTRFVIVAPDEDRQLVRARCADQQFADLKPRFLPYSAVEELRWIASKLKKTSCGDSIVDAFLEDVT